MAEWEDCRRRAREALGRWLHREKTAIHGPIKPGFWTHRRLGAGSSHCLSSCPETLNVGEDTSSTAVIGGILARENINEPGTVSQVFALLAVLFEIFREDRDSHATSVVSVIQPPRSTGMALRFRKGIQRGKIRELADASQRRVTSHSSTSHFVFPRPLIIPKYVDCHLTQVIGKNICVQVIALRLPPEAI